MRVFNLTGNVVSYRGRDLPPYGSEVYPDLKPTDRDLKLSGKTLGFGSTPPGWKHPGLSAVIRAEVEAQEDKNFLRVVEESIAAAETSEIALPAPVKAAKKK